VETVHGVCPNCKILLMESNEPTDVDLAAAVNEAVTLGATEVSNSYGGTEEAADEAAYNHPGVVIAASAGDQGLAATLYSHAGQAPSLYDVTEGGNGYCDGEAPGPCGEPGVNEVLGDVDCEGTTACDAATGFDGPSGVGTPKGLGAFKSNAVTRLTQTTATLNARVNPNGQTVTECKFEYGTSAGYGSSVSCSTLPGSGTSPVAVSAKLGAQSVGALHTGTRGGVASRPAGGARPHGHRHLGGPRRGSNQALRVHALRARTRHGRTLPPRRPVLLELARTQVRHDNRVHRARREESTNRCPTTA
jgi:hypothetical protein